MNNINNLCSMKRKGYQKIIVFELMFSIFQLYNNSMVTILYLSELIRFFVHCGYTFTLYDLY